MKRYFTFILALVVLEMAGTIFLASCKKSVALQFTGTYPGALTYAGTTSAIADTVTVAPATTSFNLTIFDSHLNITLNATVSSSYITIPSQRATISGVTDTITGTGNLAGSNLTIYLSTNSGGIAVLYSQFTGTRD